MAKVKRSIRSYKKTISTNKVLLASEFAVVGLAEISYFGILRPWGLGGPNPSSTPLQVLAFDLAFGLGFPAMFAWIYNGCRHSKNKSKKEIWGLVGDGGDEIAEAVLKERMKRADEVKIESGELLDSLYKSEQTK